MAAVQTPCDIPNLQPILKLLAAQNYPELPSPGGTTRRASVAFVIRVKPSHSCWPSDDTASADLDSFFAQEWVQRGEPEVLFIKRAARKGDRWTSHIALPGGKKDPEDEDDKAAAVRETWEEVGLDVTKYGLEAGALCQRIVTTHWGKKPLLVLCPYVFVLTSHAIPPLKLQPSEVAATHWVPLRCLQAPMSRTVVYEDVSTRVAEQETGLKKWILSLTLGQMMFAAISLVPTESLHSVETPLQDTLQDNRHVPASRLDFFKSLPSRVRHSDLFGQYPPLPPEGPLLLWGLTLGIVSDFLDLLPPHNALNLWAFPNFTPLDVRFSVWLLTYRFKERKRAELQGGTELLSRPAFGYATESLAHGADARPGPEGSDGIPSSSTVLVERPDEAGLHGLGTGTGNGQGPDKKAAVATLLEGYYDILRRAVQLALLGRASVGILVAILLWRRLKGRK